jgi:pimeloyl-ACP methyl ester carboxylesterase
MPSAKANGIEIEYELIGERDAEPLLLISGHGAQMVGYDDDFCEQLAARGFLVIRFDNRDVGLSTKMDDAPEPDLFAAIAGDHSSAAYTLADMADDADGLLDFIGISKAHVVGASMGGMIAQWFAIRHSEKTVSLVPIMTTNGDRSVGMPTPEVVELMIAPAAETLEESVNAAVASYLRFHSPGYPPETDRIRAREERAHRRSWYPAGATRQLLAIIASGDWSGELARVTVPTLVIHGDSDPVVQPDGGEAVARSIPGAELWMIPGMAHDIPEPLWTQIFDAIANNAARAKAPTGAKRSTYSETS